MKWPYYPFMIQVEATQGCNRRCEFCGSMGVEKKIYHADLDTIAHSAKLIAESGLTPRILFAGHGEPTLHPQIAEIISIFRKALNPLCMLHMFTNGTIVTKHPELIKDMFDAGLNELLFDEYSDNRITNFVNSSDICQQYNIVTKGEKDDKGKTIKLFMDKKPNAKRICIVPPIDLKEVKVTLSRKFSNHCGAGMEPAKEPVQARCSILFRDFFIRWDGNIAICCNDFRGEYFVTNIKDCSSFHEAYFHPRLNAARKFIYHKDRASVYPCSVCNVTPIRPGLLPDTSGKNGLPLPTDEDREAVKNTREPLSVIVKREWEK